MPVYKLILPVISFSSQRPLPSLRRPPMGAAVEPSEPERHVVPSDNSRADEGHTPPPAGKPFG